MTEEEQRARDGGKQKSRVSLRPVPFEEAVSDLLKVKPPPEKKKRRGKRRKAKSNKEPD